MKRSFLLIALSLLFASNLAAHSYDDNECLDRVKALESKVGQLEDDVRKYRSVVEDVRLENRNLELRMRDHEEIFRRIFQK